MEGAFVSGAVKHATGEKVLFTSNSPINTAGNTLSSVVVADALVQSGGEVKGRRMLLVSPRSLADSGIDFLSTVSPVGINDVDPTSQDITLTVVVLARLGSMSVTEAAAATSASLAQAAKDVNATKASLLPFLTAIATSSDIPVSTLSFNIAAPTPIVLSRSRTYYSYFQAWMNYIASLSGGAIAGIVLSTLAVIILIILLVKRYRSKKSKATVAPIPVAVTSAIDIIVKESSDTIIIQSENPPPPQDTTINNVNTARSRNSKRIQPAEKDDDDDKSERRASGKNGRDIRGGDEDFDDTDDSDSSYVQAEALRRAAKAEKRQLRESRRELEKKEARRTARRIARAATERSIAVTAAMATNSAREYSRDRDHDDDDDDGDDGDDGDDDDDHDHDDDHAAAVARAIAEEEADAQAVALEAEAMHTQILLAARTRALALAQRGLSTTTKTTSIRSLSPTGKPLFLSPQGAASAAAATSLYVPNQGYGQVYGASGQGPRPPRGLPPAPTSLRAMPLSAAGQRALLAGRPRPMPPLGPRQ